MGHEIKTESAFTWKDAQELKTQFESMVDVQKQNEDIIKKYKLIEPQDCMFSFDRICDVIKKLEIDIYNLRESLKLSKEINALDNEKIKVMREALKFYADDDEYHNETGRGHALDIKGEIARDALK